MEFEPQNLPYDVVIDPNARIFTGRMVNPQEVRKRFL
jgi:hypothetical protein